jgi:hypothetical protein
VKASVVRQPKKVYCETIGMGGKSITIVRAVTADFLFDCRAAKVYKIITDVSYGYETRFLAQSTVIHIGEDPERNAEVEQFDLRR